MASTGSGSEAKEKLYEAMMGIVRAILGEEISDDKIKRYTFNEVWQMVLGVPFSGNDDIKHDEIVDILQWKIVDVSKLKIFLLPVC